jgi:cephalosporin hydroxylase
MAGAHLGLRSKTLKGLRRVSALWNAASEMDALVARHQGRRLNKWQHYYEIYDRHFAPFRGREARILEIGVESGGSLELWRSYFGPAATIVGLDINPKCQAFEAPNTFVRIGSQGDEAFLLKVAAEFGPFDIVIEDGSHTYEHQIGTFRALFAHVNAGGMYCCEDLCTSYWSEEFGGGLRKSGTAMEFFKGIVDEQNAWFWRQDAAEGAQPVSARNLFGIHFYPTLCVIEKRETTAPTHVPVGRAS